MEEHIIIVPVKHQNVEAFKADANGHIFKPEDKVVIHGMENLTDLNGEVVTISAIRKDGDYGKAYYLKDNPKVLAEINWTYENRLRKIS